MSRRGAKALAVITAIAASAAVAVPAVGAGEQASTAKGKKPAKVTVNDNFYTPLNVKIKKGRS